MPDYNESDSFQTLVQAVRHNCAISDAKFAGNYSLCIYLLKMREFFRWEQGLAYETSIGAADVGDWLSDREALWDEVEESDFQPLQINGKNFDPFDNRSINAQLVPHGYVYSSGYGRFAKPSFMLARLEHQEQTPDYTLYVSGKEYARDLAAFPAAAINGEIYIRRESLRQAIWEMIDEWKLKKLDSPMASALHEYGYFEQGLDAALDQMTNDETDPVILHEIGELVAEHHLGEDWNRMLADVSCTKAEIMVRAVRDLLADCTSALPAMLYEQKTPSIHFYFANLKAMRKELSPTMGEAYKHWQQRGDLAALKSAVQKGRDHWKTAAEEIVDIYRSGGKDSAGRIEQYVVGCQL